MLGKRQKLKYEKVDDREDLYEVETSVKYRSFNKVCLWSSFLTSLLICIYYVPSVGLTFYQRWLFQVSKYLCKCITASMMAIWAFCLCTCYKNSKIIL